MLEWNDIKNICGFQKVTGGQENVRAHYLRQPNNVTVLITKSDPGVLQPRFTRDELVEEINRLFDTEVEVSSDPSLIAKRTRRAPQDWVPSSTDTGIWYYRGDNTIDAGLIVVEYGDDMFDLLTPPSWSDYYLRDKKVVDKNHFAV
jgi:hypothetical protein